MPVVAYIPRDPASSVLYTVLTVAESATTDSQPRDARGWRWADLRRVLAFDVLARPGCGGPSASCLCSTHRRPPGGPSASPSADGSARASAGACVYGACRMCRLTPAW
jgi:hypothetical protein